MIPSPAAPASTTCDNESCNPSRMIAKRRTRRTAKTTPRLKEAGVPTVLWNAKPRTIAMMSGLSAAVAVRNNPDSRLRPASQRVLNGSSALEVKACSGPVSVSLWTVVSGPAAARSAPSQGEARRTGCRWRQCRASSALTTVQHYFYAWRDSGVLERINFELLLQAREAAGREPSQLEI
jgi:hypothetical protein